MDQFLAKPPPPPQHPAHDYHQQAQQGGMDPYLTPQMGDQEAYAQDPYGGQYMAYPYGYNPYAQQYPGMLAVQEHNLPLF